MERELLVKIRQKQLINELKNKYSEILTTEQIKKVAEEISEDTYTTYSPQELFQTATEYICYKLIYNSILCEIPPEERNNQMAIKQRILEAIQSHIPPDEQNNPIAIKQRILEAIKFHESERQKAKVERKQNIQQIRLSKEDEEWLKNEPQEEAKIQFLIPKFKERREQTKLLDTKIYDENRCHNHLSLNDYYNFVNQDDKMNKLIYDEYYNFADQQDKVNKKETIFETKNIDISKIVKDCNGLLNKDEIIDIIEARNNNIEEAKLRIDMIKKMRIDMIKKARSDFKNPKALEPKGFWNNFRDLYKSKRKINKISKILDLQHKRIKKIHNHVKFDKMEKLNKLEKQQKKANLIK